MSLEALTDNIVQLCEECNVWSSTINIPHGNGDILDISAACGSQACTPKVNEGSVQVTDMNWNGRVCTDAKVC